MNNTASIGQIWPKGVIRANQDRKKNFCHILSGKSGKKVEKNQERRQKHGKSGQKDRKNFLGAK